MLLCCSLESYSQDIKPEPKVIPRVSKDSVPKVKKDSTKIVKNDSLLLKKRDSALLQRKEGSNFLFYRVRSARVMI